jgi:hypothetical protein
MTALEKLKHAQVREFMENGWSEKYTAMGRTISKNDVTWEESVICFMAKVRGLDRKCLTEDKEYNLLMEFNDTDGLQRDFRINY